MKRAWELVGTLLLAFVLGAVCAAAWQHPERAGEMLDRVWWVVLLGGAAKALCWGRRPPRNLVSAVWQGLLAGLGLMVLLGLTVVVSNALGAADWAQRISNAADVVAVLVLLAIPVVIAAAWTRQP